ncbi:unnamed protein product [Schistocephalus solidus]|uniref:Reverse transcriptase domain-containing protein n=1 Tax=Schistocephalus solidus TaxID=70667 RepID=A0A183TLP1_SCHSO|nr:unnamed protein product [Schistocephalus solidus]
MEEAGFNARVHDLLFADDCALNTVTKEDMQRSMDLFASGCADFGLTISTPKTVVMHQPPPTAKYNAPRINVNGAQFKNVETFAYLGGTMSRNTRIDDELAQRICKASQAFSRLQAFMCNRHGIHVNTKLKMYKVVVLATLIRSGGLDHLLEVIQEAESLPSQLILQNTEADMARQDP